MSTILKRVRTGLVGVLVLGFGLLGGVGCAVTPEQELQLGLENHAAFEKQGGGEYPDATIQQYVSAVGGEMARHAGRPDMKWQFKVLNSDQVNAFAVPGGYIYITQGLLFRMRNEAQLAGVLGHEAGHIAHRHSARQIETQRYVGVATVGISVVAQQAGYATVGQATELVSQLGMLRYSREHETEADFAGLKYMTEAGYNPNGIVQLMQILQSTSGGGGGGLAEWTSSHPNPGNRIEYLKEAIAKDHAQLAQSGAYREKEFQQNVLSRRKAELSPINTFAWCGWCRAETESVAQADAGELMRDVIVSH